MRKICIINQKGGVGKTTTTVSIAHGLAAAGRKVLIIDLDPQGNVAHCLPAEKGNGIYSFLIEGKPFYECAQQLGENLFLLPANETLTKAELMLAGEQARETFLKRKMKEVVGFDYVLLDCPPSLGLLNQNALLYADEAITPTSTDPLGVDALAKMGEAIETINDVFSHQLRISAVVPTLYDVRLRTCRESLARIQERHYERVTSPVRVNSKLREAPGEGRTIFDHARSSNGAKDYHSVLQFLLQQELQKTAPWIAAKA